MGYRSAPLESIRVVRYRPAHPIAIAFYVVWAFGMAAAFVGTLRPGWPALAAIGAFFTVFLSLRLHTARLDFRFDRGTIAYTMRRWPFPALRRTIRLDEIDGGRILRRRGRGEAYAACILLEGGELIDLVPGQASSMKRVDRTVSEINALVEEMRALRL